MTQDQLEEAHKISLFAEATRKKAEHFRQEVGKDGHISFGGCNATNMQANGGYYLSLANRPEVLMAARACEAIMQQAIDAEAARWAKAFDDFTITA